MKKPKPQRHWKQYEIDFVFRSYKQGLPFTEVAIYLDRSIRSVRMYFQQNKHIYLPEYEILRQ